MKSFYVLVACIASMAAASPMPAELDTRMQWCGHMSCPPSMLCCDECGAEDSVCIRGSRTAVVVLDAQYGLRWIVCREQHLDDAGVAVADSHGQCCSSPVILDGDVGRRLVRKEALDGLGVTTH
ncbi:hypothetical protein LLEC1_07073 [Akanthomyces lecanii]|uniref:Hydrophobin n=1 Tax=Cordyceps confragosa TaxID=2714763 RepID=A0A179I4W7_CORDF|nr:hypothetical protein LLEC1_07073 [Akanthomyces lecanii]